MADQAAAEAIANSPEVIYEKAIAYISSGGGKTQGDPEESPEDQVLLYALEQQATVGDNATPRPGLLDFKGKGKWDAWKALEGTSKADAQQKYVAKVKELHPNWENWTGELAAGTYVIPASYDAAEVDQWVQDAMRLKADEEGWEPPYVNQNGIVVTRKAVDATGFKLRKETGVVKGHSPSQVFELFLNYERRKEWDSLMDKSVVLKELSANSCVVCISTKSPSRVVWPREFLVTVTWRTLDDGTLIRVAKSIKDDKLYPPQATHVRGTMLLSAYICSPHPDGCHITDLKQVDGAGWVPVSIVEMAEKTSTVANIRKALGAE